MGEGRKDGLKGLHKPRNKEDTRERGSMGIAQRILTSNPHAQETMKQDAATADSGRRAKTVEELVIPY